MEHIILDISGIDNYGHSFLDWEYAKRKQKEPDIRFEDVLKEKLKELEEKNEYERNRTVPK